MWALDASAHIWAILCRFEHRGCVIHFSVKASVEINPKRPYPHILDHSVNDRKHNDHRLK